jgi:hypothetical protein
MSLITFDANYNWGWNPFKCENWKEGANEVMKSIVVFYSLTNKTRLVAQNVAEGLNAKLLEIKEKKQRTLGRSTYFWAGLPR